MTGSYEAPVPDEDREAWVLIDAAAPKLVRPPRPETSPDYATRVQLRTAEIMTHLTLEDAQQAIETAVGDGVTIGRTNIWKRPRDGFDFRPSVYTSSRAPPSRSFPGSHRPPLPGEPQRLLYRGPEVSDAALP